MRIAPVLILVVGSVAWGQSPPNPSGPEEKTEAARASQAADLARKAAEEYRIAVGKTPLTLEPTPLLQWSNPVAGSIHGSVFIWTAEGRPEAVASIYKWFTKFHHLGVEFHSLALGPLDAERAGQPAWFPSRAGVLLLPIPEAPTPADSPAQRLRQLRTLAKEFSASETTREGVSRELRLLTQPIYRYASTDATLIDGALFAFVEGTDPEVFLLIEARRTEKGVEWQYGLARMNSIACRVAHRGREVWNQPEIPWSQVFDHREPYTLFTFQPGQGVNPPGTPDPAPSR
jgi:hypothetical protein